MDIKHSFEKLKSVFTSDKKLAVLCAVGVLGVVLLIISEFIPSGEKSRRRKRKRLRPLRFLPKNPHSLLRRSPRTARTSILMNLMSMPTSSKICMNDAEVLAWQLST